MKSTLIGHACLLIRSKNTTLLTDPCLFDIHFEELNVYYPNVEILRDKIPPYDVLYISHRHQDHFDIRTLASLPKDRPVLIPKDDIIRDVMEELEFTDVTQVENFEPVKVKDLTLTPTPSITKDPYPEHGLLVHDGEVTLWNQVDTIVTPDIVNYIIQLYGQLDFAHVRFEPLLEQNFAFHQALNLPFQEYQSFLQVVNALNPKFIVPGSAGERYVDRFAFQNHFVFPSTPQQFLRDLKEFCPQVQSSFYWPGDSATITPQGVTIESQEADFVRALENKRGKVLFNPVRGVPGIETLTEAADQRASEKERVREFIQNEFIDRLSSSEMLEAWNQWKLGYMLEVFDVGGDSEVWTIDFGKDLRIMEGYPDRVSLYEGISVSEFYRLIHKETNWDFVGASAQFRTFHNIYRVDEGRFEFFPQDKSFPGVLMQVFPNNAEMEREKFFKDVRRWKNAF